MQNKKSIIKHIKGFYFGYARYRVEDGRGDVVLVKINYKADRYQIVPKSEKVNEKFRKEVARVAENLLGRKHGNNFVDRLKV